MRNMSILVDAGVDIHRGWLLEVPVRSTLRRMSNQTGTEFGFFCLKKSSKGREPKVKLSPSLVF